MVASVKREEVALGVALWLATTGGTPGWHSAEEVRDSPIIVHLLKNVPGRPKRFGRQTQANTSPCTLL